MDDNVDPKYYLSEKLLTTLKNHKNNHSAVKSGFGYIVVNEEKIQFQIQLWQQVVLEKKET